MPKLTRNRLRRIVREEKRKTRQIAEARVDLDYNPNAPNARELKRFLKKHDIEIVDRRGTSAVFKGNRAALEQMVDKFFAYDDSQAQHLKSYIEESAKDAAKDADEYMDGSGMPKDVAANAAAKKHGENKEDVKKHMSELRGVVRQEIRKALNEVQPKDFRGARRKLARYLEKHAVTDTQMDTLVSMVSQQGLPTGLDNWMAQYAEPFMNLDRGRLADLLRSSGVAQP
jgi:hypothetical protein